MTAGDEELARRLTLQWQDEDQHEMGAPPAYRPAGGERAEIDQDRGIERDRRR